LLFRRLNITDHGHARVNSQKTILNKSTSKKMREIIAIAYFVIWRERCNRIFRDQNKLIDLLIEEVRDEWMLHQDRVRLL
jgi:hypothetical protein